MKIKKIIKNALPNKTILSTHCVTTGWTNIVYEVCTSEQNFFFRFPRDDFWAKTIIKDYEFSKFIYGKTDFNTVQLDLTPEEVKIVSNDIAKFMFQLHSLEFDKDLVFQTNNIGLDLVSFLDELLNVHVDSIEK